MTRFYTVKDILEAAGMNRNEFAYCRRKMGIKARGKGCSSVYTAKEVSKIVSAFHSLFPVKDYEESRVDEIRQIIRDSGY